MQAGSVDFQGEIRARTLLLPWSKATVIQTFCYRGLRLQSYKRFVAIFWTVVQPSLLRVLASLIMMSIGPVTTLCFFLFVNDQSL